jgi:16S rRNA (guanine966-N2)-methyltransferase
VRVIAGKFKSRPLRALSGMDTRPTSDRLRETLFNVLTAGNPAALEGTDWLDLFAGTGAVGIEALSRGAHRVTFVDSSRAAVAVIRENLKSLGIVEEFGILAYKAQRALRELDKSFDYIFIDPPYAKHDLYEETLAFVGGSGLLRPNSVVIVEHDKRFDPGETAGTLQRSRSLVQGDSALSFYSLAQDKR